MYSKIAFWAFFVDFPGNVSRDHPPCERFTRKNVTSTFQDNPSGVVRRIGIGTVLNRGDFLYDPMCTLFRFLPVGEGAIVRDVVYAGFAGRGDLLRPFLMARPSVFRTSPGRGRREKNARSRTTPVDGICQADRIRP